MTHDDDDDDEEQCAHTSAYDEERHNRFGELLEQVGVPMAGWVVGDSDAGWFLDWPGCPLIVKRSDDDRISVRAHLGGDAVGVADYEQRLEHGPW